MKIVSDILVLFALCAAIVEGSWLAATANKLIEPIIISAGAAIFATMGQEDKTNFNSVLHDWKQKFTFSRDNDDGDDKDKEKEPIPEPEPARKMT